MAALRPSHVVGAHYGMGDASIIFAYRDYIKDYSNPIYGRG